MYFIKLLESTQGAPIVLNGCKVPLPSDILVPSNKHVPLYIKAVSLLGIFGDVGSH